MFDGFDNLFSLCVLNIQKYQYVYKLVIKVEVKLVVEGTKK